MTVAATDAARICVTRGFENRRRGVRRLADGTVDFTVDDADQWETVKSEISRSVSAVRNLIPQLAAAFKYRLYLIDYPNQRAWVADAFSVGDRHARRIIKAARQLAAIESDGDPRLGWPERCLRELGRVPTADRDAVIAGMQWSSPTKPRFDQVRDAVDRSLGMTENDISRRNAHELLDDVARQLVRADAAVADRLRDEAVRHPLRLILEGFASEIGRFRKSELHR